MMIRDAVVNMKIGTRLWLLVGFVSVMLAGSLALGMAGMQSGLKGMKAIYQERAVPMQRLKKISDMYTININANTQKLLSESLTWKEGREGFLTAQTTIDEQWREFLSVEHSDDEERHIGELNSLFEVTSGTFERLGGMLKDENRPRLTNFFIDELSPTIEPILRKISELMDVQMALTEKAYRDAESRYITARAVIIACALCGLIIAAAAAYWIVRGISAPLTLLAEDVQSIAGGDLRVNISYGSRDQIGVLASAMNTMVRSLNSIANRIACSSNDISNTVGALKSHAAKTSEGSQRQAVLMAQVASASDQMNRTITDIAQNASTASKTSVDAMEMAKEGRAVADTAVDKINSVHHSTLGLAESIEKLNTRVTEIGGIVTVIKDIADQTNLLALNAAIEAARAGDQGRGFAVVADEVRKLAERTIKATSEIADKIKAVQTESDKTGLSMQESAAGVEQAREFIFNVEGSLDGIVEVVHKVRDQITQIAASVDEQSRASEHVTCNIEETSGTSKEIETTAALVMQEVDDLVVIGDSLLESISKLKLNGQGVPKHDNGESPAPMYAAEVLAVSEAHARSGV